MRSNPADDGPLSKGRNLAIRARSGELVESTKERGDMDEKEALAELDQVLAPEGQPYPPEGAETLTDDGEGFIPTPPGACEVCHKPLIAHDTYQTAEGYNGECGHCYWGDLNLGARLHIVEEMVMPIAAQWGEAETFAKLKEAVDLAGTLADSRDSRLLGQWADGFFAGLVASRKLPANRGFTPEAFAKLVEDHSSESVLTGD